MWRSLFLAIGITSCIFGAQCLFIEKAVLAAKPKAATESNRLFDLPFSQITEAKPKELAPPEWAPWSLLSVGAVVIIYSFTLPRLVSD